MGEQALHCEMVASSFTCQPNHSSMFCLHSDHTRGRVVAAVLHSIWPTNARDYPAVLFIGLWPQFHKIMYLYSICLVSTMCCDTTITLHKRNTNIQELCTLPGMISLTIVFTNSITLLMYSTHHATTDLKFGSCTALSSSSPVIEASKFCPYRGRELISDSISAIEVPPSMWLVLY